jgi:hypothetical protein
MANRSHSVHLPLLRTDAVVEAPQRDDAPPAQTELDEAARMEESLETDADAVFQGFRLALGLAVAFWAVIAVVLVWLL